MVNTWCTASAQKRKKLSNADRVSRTDPEAKIAKMKDGTTHLAYKPEHAVDLDTGAVIAAELHPADQGDTTTLPATLRAAEVNLVALGAAPTPETPAECVTDKGYFTREVLKSLGDGVWKTRIARLFHSEINGLHDGLSTVFHAKFAIDIA